MDFEDYVGRNKNKFFTGLLVLISIGLLFLNYGKITTFGELEVWGFVTGLWSIWLAVFNRPSNWLIGFVNEAIFFVMFWQIGLYANAWLQVFFAVISAYGLIGWLWGGKARTELPVRYAGWFHFGKWIIVIPLLTIIIGLILEKFTGSAGLVADNLTTAISIVATYLLAARRIENWTLWFTADLIYLYLLSSQGLYLTMALYGIFTLMCIKGFIDWRRIERSPKNQEQIKALMETV